MKRVLHVIKSPSFNSDGRLQKWVGYLKSNNIDSEVLIVEDDNSAKNESLYGLHIFRRSLKSRKLFPKRSGYLFKIPEYFFLVKSFIKKSNSDVLIFHDVQQYLNLFYALAFGVSKSKMIVWDLHELPHKFLLENNLAKKFLRYILNNIDLVIYTNSERRDFIISKIKGVNEKKYFILNNYPETKFIDAEKTPIDIPNIDSKPYFLWLGAGIKGRNFDSFLSSYNQFKDRFNLVVIGKIDNIYSEKIRLLKSEGKIFNKFVNQGEIIHYIDGAFLSVVLYKSNSANSYYCEPNRLYQLLSRKVPVIVGNNPTMANLVQKLQTGLVLNDDGGNPVELSEKIDQLIENYDEVKSNFIGKNISELFSWEMQIDQIINHINAQL